VIIVVAAVLGLGFVGRTSVVLFRSAVASGACLAYSVWVGGDAWEWSLILNRYISVCLPLIAVMCFVALGRLQQLPPRRAAVGSSAFIGALAAGGVGLGLLSNPNRFDRALALGSGRRAFVLGALTVLALLTVGIVRHLRWVAACSAGLFLVASIGWTPMRTFVESDALHVRDDAFKSEQARALRRVSSDDARIATVWAGAPGYYSERAMVDLLGKSDRHVASVEPRGELYPGHNKWDYAYSIGQLQPDIVIDYWLEPANAQAILAQGGYQWRCFLLTSDGTTSGAWFRMSSTAIAWESTTAC